MHSNVWTTFYLLWVPCVLILLIGLMQWIIKHKFPKKTIVFAIILALPPLTFLLSHINSEREEMIKRQGKYILIKSENLQELCTTSNTDNLQLTLSKSGTYSFNIKPCFADRKEGIWKWRDDLVGAHVVFDIKINGYAHFLHDENDTLKLMKGGKTYLTFVKQELQNTYP